MFSEPAVLQDPVDAGGDSRGSPGHAAVHTVHPAQVLGGENITVIRVDINFLVPETGGVI